MVAPFASTSQKSGAVVAAAVVDAAGAVGTVVAVVGTAGVAVVEPVRAQLEPVAVAVGKAWAHERMAALRADARGVIGAWPGTLAEARMRIRTTLRSKLELALLEDLARIAYVAARRGWQQESERDCEP